MFIAQMSYAYENIMNWRINQLLPPSEKLGFVELSFFDWGMIKHSRAADASLSRISDFRQRE